MSDKKIGPADLCLSTAYINLALEAMGMESAQGDESGRGEKIRKTELLRKTVLIEWEKK